MLILSQASPIQCPRSPRLEEGGETKILIVVGVLLLCKGYLVKSPPQVRRVRGVICSRLFHLYVLANLPIRQTKVVLCFSFCISDLCVQIVLWWRRIDCEELRTAD